VKSKVIWIFYPIMMICILGIIFFFTSRLINPYIGYLIGKFAYWMLGCLIVPSILLKKNILNTMKMKEKFLVFENWWIIILFGITIIVPLFMYNTFDKVINSSAVILITAIPFSIMNSVCEESLWRGCYLSIFKRNVLWAVFMPSFLFSLWHIAPQMALPHDNVILFAISTFPLGLVYAIMTYKTQSTFWSIIGHTISGIFALSGPDALSFSKIFAR
jgi:uncharacterized protein